MTGYSFEFDTSGIQDVSALANFNLINAQKELLKMSWIFGISMRRLQELMQPSLVQDADGTKRYLDPVLKSDFESTRTCDIPQSETWILACGKARTPQVMHE